MTDYSNNIVKKYKFWTVLVFPKQQYLGRCVIWCDRGNAYDLTDATIEEQQELFQIIKEMKIAIEKAFDSDWMNYSFLGNSERHLHCHMVPRYKDKREFENVVFEDKRWGHNWLTDENHITTNELLQAIKIKLQNSL